MLRSKYELGRSGRASTSIISCCIGSSCCLLGGVSSVKSMTVLRFWESRVGRNTVPGTVTVFVDAFAGAGSDPDPATLGDDGPAAGESFLLISVRGRCKEQTRCELSCCFQVELQVRVRFRQLKSQL